MGRPFEDEGSDPEEEEEADQDRDAPEKGLAAQVVEAVSRGNRNCVLVGRSAVISCSKTAPETSSTTRTQTDELLGVAAMNGVSTPRVAMVKDALVPVSVGAQVRSFATNCQRVAEKPDLTMRAHTAVLASRGVQVAHDTVWLFVKLSGQTVKKRP